MTVAALRALLQQDDYTITMMNDGTGVLMDLRKETLLTLNGTAALILAGIDEGASKDEIVARVIQKYQVDEGTACTDVETFLVKLGEAVGVSG